MTARPAHTRTASTRSAFARRARLVLLAAGLVVGASACELGIGGDDRPATATGVEGGDPAAVPVAAATPDAGPAATDPSTAGAPVATGLPADADRGGAVPPSVAPSEQDGGTAPVAASQPPSQQTPTQQTQPPATAPSQPPTTTAAPTTAPATTAPATTAPATTAPGTTTTAPTTTMAPTTTTMPPTTTAPTAPPTTMPPTSQPPLTLPPYTVPPLTVVTYRVDVSPVTLALSAACLPAGRSSLSVAAERYVTGHTFEPFQHAVGTSPVAFGTPISMTTDTVGQGYAGFMTWTVEGFQQRESDFAISRLGATQVRDHRSITSVDGTRSCQVDATYTVTVTAL